MHHIPVCGVQGTGNREQGTVRTQSIDYIEGWVVGYQTPTYAHGGVTPNDAKQPKTVVLGLFMCHRTALEDRAHYEQHGSRCCVVVVCFLLPEVAPDPPGSWGHACRVAAA